MEQEKRLRGRPRKNVEEVAKFVPIKRTIVAEAPPMPAVPENQIPGLLNLTEGIVAELFASFDTAERALASVLTADGKYNPEEPHEGLTDLGARIDNINISLLLLKSRLDGLAARSAL